MRKRDSEKRAHKRQRDHDRLQKQFASLSEKGPFVKRVLRRRGVNLPFYDYFDSYFREYARVVEDAKRAFPTLIEVVEVSDDVYYSKHATHVPAGMDQIFWEDPGDVSGYGVSRDADSNLNGFTNAFHTSDGQLRTRVIIRQTVPGSKPHREFKYAMKLMALLHELGHVHDIEHSINFDHSAKRCNIVEAEVFAQLYSLERMAKMNYYQCFLMLVNALKSCAGLNDYRAKVAKLTLERMPDYRLVDVLSIPLEPLTVEDLEALGPDGRRAFGAN